jgi:hypothetical protein
MTFPSKRYLLHEMNRDKILNVFNLLQVENLVIHLTKLGFATPSGVLVADFCMLPLRTDAHSAGISRRQCAENRIHDISPHPEVCDVLSVHRAISLGLRPGNLKVKPNGRRGVKTRLFAVTKIRYIYPKTVAMSGAGDFKFAIHCGNQKSVVHTRSRFGENVTRRSDRTESRLMEQERARRRRRPAGSPRRLAAAPTAAPPCRRRRLQTPPMAASGRRQPPHPAATAWRP